MLVSMGIQLQRSATISFVGAGGKSSLIFALAKDLSDKGYGSLVTTTTAMFHPNCNKFAYDKIVVDEKLNFRELSFNTKDIVVIASKYNKKKRKLTGYSHSYVNNFSKLSSFDFILVEADGARLRSIKAPGFNEPVIPESTSIVVGCVGLDCIGQPINENNVHRLEYFLSISDSTYLAAITEKNILTLASSDEGLFKNVSKKTSKIIFLNKADDTIDLDRGERIGYAIKRNCPSIERTIVACLKDIKDPIKLVV